MNSIIIELNNNISQITYENIELKNKNKELLEEKKSKSSSTLWESTHKQLREKDVIIEQLKKDSDFYKRQYKASNILSNYPYSNLSEQNTIKLEKEINKINIHNNNNDDNNDNDNDNDKKNKKDKKKKDKTKEKSKKDKKKKMDIINIDTDNDELIRLERELDGY